MATIRAVTESCMRGFAVICSAAERQDDLRASSGDDMAEEFGRFRVWTGNLGALAKGHSALDWRLRDAEVMRTTVLSLLQELNNELELAVELRRDDFPGVVLGAEAIDDEPLDDISIPSDDELHAVNQPGDALSYLSQSIQDLITDLYKLSFRIRNSTTKSTRAVYYTEVDPSSGLEIFGDCYAVFDIDHVNELFRSLRKDSSLLAVDDNVLVQRFAKSNTARRRQFGYWQRHAQKLSVIEPLASTHLNAKVSEPLQGSVKLESAGEVHMNKQPVRSQHTRTIHTTTEATSYDPKLDLTSLETQSVISSATTARDLEGRPADLPPPPTAATNGQDFVCPYCFVLCPSSHGQGRAWRKHILQDLQAYVCTYTDCSSGDRLYASRREWLEHEEAQHRKTWLCRFHPSLCLSSQHDLEQHLNEGNHGTLTQSQITEFASIAQSVAADSRERCPVCLEKTAGIPRFPAHLANHLERIATFSLPRLIDDGDSSLASFKAVPQSMSDRESFSSISSNLSCLKSTQDNGIADSQEGFPKDEIVSWLLGFGAVKPQEQPSCSLDLALVQSFLESSEVTSWINSFTPQRLICCGLDLSRLTLFASAVATKLEAKTSPQVPIICLFIPSELSESSEITKILANLLGQVFAKGPENLESPELFELYEEAKASGTMPSKSALSALLKSFTKPFAKLYLVSGDSNWDQVWFTLTHALSGVLSLLVYTTDFYEPTPPRVCDLCDQTTLTYWRCIVCDNGSFDLCPPCESRGLSCRDASHDLVLHDPSRDQVVINVDSLFVSNTSHQDLAQTVRSQMISFHQSYPADRDQRSVLLDNVYEKIMEQDVASYQDKDLAMAALEVAVHSTWPLRPHQFEPALRHVMKIRNPGVSSGSSTNDALEATRGLLVVKESYVKLFDLSLFVYFHKTHQRWFPNGSVHMAMASLLTLTSYELPVPMNMLWTTDSFFGHAACAWGDYLRECAADSIVGALALSYLRDDERLKVGTMTAFMLQPSEMAYGLDIGEGLKAIHVCSIFGLTDMIQRRLSFTSLDLDMQAPVHGRTPLAYACRMGHVQTAQVLLNFGANPNLLFIGGPTILHEAIKLEHHSIVELLLRSPAVHVTSLTSKEDERSPLLMRLSQLQSIEILHLALSRDDIDVNEKDHNGRTTVWWLLSTSHHRMTPEFLLSAVQTMLSHSMLDINVVDVGGRSYLMLLLCNLKFNLRVLELLLDRGVDINLRDECGETAIFYAVRCQRSEDVISRLIEGGADLSVQDCWGEGLLHRIVRSVETTQDLPVNLLLRHMPTLINSQDGRGRTPLHLALFLGKIRFALELLSLGADTVTVDNSGRTAFDIARQYGRTSLLERLSTMRDVSNKVHVEAMDQSHVPHRSDLPGWSLGYLGLFDEMHDRLDDGNIDMLDPSPDDGNTALHWLVKSTLHRPDLTEMILQKFLVKTNAGCSPQNLIRDTPLHTAIAADHTVMARMLIQNGANLTAQDDLERTPLDLAKELSRTEIVTVIEAQLACRSEHALALAASR